MMGMKKFVYQCLFNLYFLQFYCFYTSTEQDKFIGFIESSKKRFLIILNRNKKGLQALLKL